MTSSAKLIDHLRKELSLAESVGDVCLAIKTSLQRYFFPDIIALHSNTPLDGIKTSLLGKSRLHFSYQGNSPTFSGQQLRIAEFIDTINPANNLLAEQILIASHYRSVALIPIYISKDFTALLEVAVLEKSISWDSVSQSLLERIAEYAGLHLSRVLGQRKDRQIDDSPNIGEWIAQSSNLVTVETNAEFTVSAIAGDTEKLLGLSPQQIVGDSNFWTRVLHPSDAKKLLLKTQRGEPTELEDEFRVVNQRTAELHALLVSARPRFDNAGKLDGWVGIALDITDRYEARRELLIERSRLEALYKVSRAQQSSSNGSVVALKCLKVLISAIQADSGLVVMSPSGQTRPEVVASSGFAFRELERFEQSENFNSILDREFFDDRVRVLEGSEALANFSDLFSSEVSHWRVAQVALIFEDQNLGTMFLCTRKPKFFTPADLELLDIAASQVALSTSQAELFIAEKEQASSLAALYRLSHELSQQLSAQDVIEHAVPIIKDELACKRIWLGVMNEQQTLLIGQSGIGPGMRDGVSDLTIDLSMSHPFLDTAIRTRQSVIVPVGAYTVCPDLMRMFDRLEIGPFAIVPLVALGQVVGVLAVEPLAANSFFGEKKRQLLDSMASEIATIILARRFESRVADSAKMRMAALLSSGVAHNFNNMLQAIMGQASLIELESLTQEQRTKIARMIMDAASKGANLVKQLYSFSSEATFSPDFLSVRSLLVDLKDRFKVQLGENIQLEYQIADESLEIKGDSSMIQQVFSNLIENAKEALEGTKEPKVKISANRLRIRSGEIHADLAPGSYVSITVEDNGAGMTEEEVARCFEPFYSTKNVDPRTGLSFNGAGLGLSSAYLIVRQHEGAILARSQKGSGTSFTVYLPIVTLKTKETDREQTQIGEAFDPVKKAR